MLRFTKAVGLGQKVTPPLFLCSFYEVYFTYKWIFAPICLSGVTQKRSDGTVYMEPANTCVYTPDSVFVGSSQAGCVYSPSFRQEVFSETRIQPVASLCVWTGA